MRSRLIPVALLISVVVVAWIILRRLNIRVSFETIFFMPYVTSTIAIGIVFRYFFNGDYGIINFFLGLIGIPAVNWFDNVNMSMPTLIIFWGYGQFSVQYHYSSLVRVKKHRFRALQNCKNVWCNRIVKSSGITFLN